MTDQSIIDRILAGDRQAFGLLVASYEGKAMSLALRMVRNENEARDVVQDAFVKAYTSLAQFRRSSAFSTWFYRIVYTTCLNSLNRSRRGPELVSLDDDVHAAWIETTMFDEVDSTQLETVIREELDRMPPLYAVAMELFYARDCSYEQICQITGMPVGTVKTRLNRGRKLLRAAMAKRFPDLEITQ